MLPPVPWRADLLTGLINQLTSIRLWNKSAVVRVMLQAAQDLEGVEGYRALVVLTDGEDNRWLRDAEANPQQLDVAPALRARFDQSGIAVHVIAYRVNDSLERDRTQAQFQVVTQLKTPGSFLLADEAGMLAERLERSMPRGLNYRVLQGDNRPVAGMPPTGIPVGRPGTLDRPLRLAPGGYQLWLQGQERPGKEFVVDSGRWLLLKVVPGSGTSNLEVIRGLYASELFPFRPSRRDSRSEWTLSALQNGAESGGGLQMVLALERTFDRREAILQSIYPRDVWIELAPESGDAPGYRDPSCGVTRISGVDLECGCDELAIRRRLEAASRPGAGSLVGSRPARDPRGFAGVWTRLSGPRRLARADDRGRGRKGDHGERFHGDSDGHDRFRAKRTATLSGCAGRPPTRASGSGAS